MNVGRWHSGLWNIYNIELYKLMPADLLEPNLPGLLPLVPLTKGATWAEAEEAMRRAAAVQPAEAARVLGNALGILLGDAMNQKEQANALFWRYFMTFYERMLEEIPWLREAREEGRDEGLAEGELLGMREVALRTLAARFAPVPAEIEAALQTADKAHLLDVATHAGTDTLEEVRARLGLPERQN
jgi:predicted transposase YdaD